MKKRTVKISIPYLAATLIGFLFLTTNFQAAAQTTVNTEATVSVPSNKTYLYVALRGGDGGHNNLSGGQGAWVEGYLKIGTGTYELHPGGTLKVIAGEAGKNSTQASGGGGGSALVYQKPNTSNWVVLAVAGGGGGAGASNGGAASVELRDATAGNTDGFHYFGGGSAFNDSNTRDSARGRAGMNNNQPTRAAGGSEGSSDGGRGFGSGAAGIYIFGDMGSSTRSGGGGGGYYGGDGVEDKGGKGGGSYYDSNYFPKVFAIANGTTNSTRSGYVNYQFTDQAPGLGKSIQFAYNTNKCIDDYRSSTSNGNNIQTYNCTGNSNQQWYIHPENRSIRSLLDLNKCLDLDNSNTANGTNIQLWDCNSTSAQKWVYNGLYKTIHSGVNSDKCFDATNGSAYPNSNVNLQLWDCNYTSNNMKWEIDGATTVSTPVLARYIIPVLAPNYAVHSHTANESGSNIQLWTKDQTNYAEVWYFDGLAIKMREFRDLCIDLKSSNTSNGNNIQLYNCNGTNAQKWLYDGMTKSIRSVINPDKCMQIEKNTDGVYGKRSNVDIQDCNGSAAQQFLIQE